MSQLSINFQESESEKKKRIMDWLEKKDPRFIEEARRIARHCCHKWTLGFHRWGLPRTVCADYIREEMYIERVPDDRHKVMGSIFKTGFVRVGFINSQAKGSHNRMIGLWTLPEYLEEIKNFQLTQNSKAS